MSTQIQRRRGTTAQHASFTGAVGETTIDTDKEVVVVHDGVQVGGYPQMRENGSNSALALGSAATPSLKFTGDTNTGIYSPGADQLAISTNGTGRLFVDANGNTHVVAVDGQLSLSKTGLRQYQFRVTGAGANEGLAIRDESGATEIARFTQNGYFTVGGLRIKGSDTQNSIYQSAAFGLSSDNYITVGTGASQTERLRITSAGLVGVGTSSPGYALSVNGVIQNNNTLFLSQGVQGNSSGITFSGLGSNYGRLYERANDSWSLGYAGSFGGASSSVLTWNSSGNVGIGTSSPSVELTISQGATGVGTNGRIALGDVGPGTPSARIDGYRAATSFAGELHLYTSTALGTVTRAVTIDSSQRVGIGTTSPSDSQSFGNALDMRGSTGSAYYSATSDNSTRAYFATFAGGGYVGTETNHPLIIRTNNGEKARVDTSGRLLVGTSSARAGWYNNGSVITGTQIEGTSFGNSTLSLTTNQAAASESAALLFGKSRGTSNGSFTVVQDGDRLGSISFQGADGSEVVEAAFIQCLVDGTPGANDMPGRLVFSTTKDGQSSPTEACRIDSSQNLLIGTTLSNLGGTTSTGINLIAGGTIRGSASDTAPLLLNRLTSNGEIQYFQRQGSTVGSITVTTSATAYNTSSDYRLKENVTAVTDGITRLQQLKPSRFNFIADPSKTVDGFIAHEVQAVVPEAIHGTKDAVDDDGNPIYQGIDQSKLVPLLTAALQEAIGEIESLKARVAALESA